MHVQPVRIEQEHCFRFLPTSASAVRTWITHFVLPQARVLQQYVEERSVTPLALNYDFALITLSNAAPKGTTYLDIAAGDGTVRYDLTTAGYPADKSGQDMWTVRLPVCFDSTLPGRTHVLRRDTCFASDMASS
jgi:hypothetical protein